MDEFDAALGISQPDPQQLLARALVEADYTWIHRLVEIRKQRGLNQTDLGKIMGRSQSVVSDIESMSGDPRLSTLRRYALAVGARVEHHVTDDDLEASIELPRRIRKVRSTKSSAHHRARADHASAGWRQVKAHVLANTEILREPVLVGD
jgi:transcriptional regulator with XRE-family HTH domain